ncbi:hypothetical protein KI387_021501, partial [Taxus chinensis]
LHGGMCIKLARLAHKVIKIFPALEAVQPRCTPGIQSLCTLHLTLDKATALIQHCAECSKLYLAVTGDSVLVKFVKIKDALNRSLSDLEEMVPRDLSRQIAEIVEELEGMTFALEPSEKEIGNVIITLLQQSSGSCNSRSELDVFHQAADRLGIMSPRAMLKERRDLKKLLEKAQAEEDQRKISVIIYFLHLLKISTKHFSFDYLDFDSENSDARLQSSRRVASEVNSERQSNVSISEPPLVDLAMQESINSTKVIPVPPEEFRCPISLQLMSDPVVISSGQTYEKLCIEKWFRDGHDTCPKTQQKLSHLSVTPNHCIKALITNWCEKYGIKVQDPLSQPTPTSHWGFDMPASNIYLHPNDDTEKDVKRIPLVENIAACTVEEEDENIPDGNLGSNFNCDSLVLENQGLNGSKDTNLSSYDIIDSDITEEDICMKYEMLLISLMTPPLESQCQAAEKIKLLSEDDDRACCYVGAKGIIPALVSFLQFANDASNIKAQTIGALALLSIARNDRNKGLILSAGALPLLLDLIHSEAIEVALAVMLALSNLEENKTSFVASGAISPLLELLESEDGRARFNALNILYNLSTTLWEWTNVIPMWSISKLAQLLGNSEHADKCITILHNLAGTEEGRATIVETEGCILAIAELLDTGDLEEQEQAVDILIQLCTNSLEYSHLVLREGVIPSLVTISVAGSPNGREKAQKLLEHFREQRLRNCSLKTSQPVISISETFSNEDEPPGEIRKPANDSSKKSGQEKSFFSKLRFLFPTCVSFPDGVNQRFSSTLAVSCFRKYVLLCYPAKFTRAICRSERVRWRGEPFTHSRRARGEVDPIFDLLRRHNFSITPARFASLSSANRSARSVSPPRKSQISQGASTSTCSALLLSGTTLPARVLFPTFQMAANLPVPWGNAMGPLALSHPVNPLPHGNHKNFPKFDGRGNQSTNAHIATFIMSCSILDT